MGDKKKVQNIPHTKERMSDTIGLKKSGNNRFFFLSEKGYKSSIVFIEYSFSIPGGVR